MVLEEPKVTAGLCFQRSLGKDCPLIWTVFTNICNHCGSLFIVQPHSTDRRGQWSGLICGVENPDHVQRHISAAQFHPLNRGEFPLHRVVWLDLSRVTLGLSVAIVMGEGGCCPVDLSLACIEKERMEEDEDPTWYKCN